MNTDKKTYNIRYIAAKTVRVVTVAPFNAFVLLMLLWRYKPEFFLNKTEFWVCAAAVSFIPLAGYLVQVLLPKLKHGGRTEQRRLAIISAGVGYAFGAICAFCFNFGAYADFLLITYFFCGLLIIVFNNLIHIRASGHACGISGPVCSLIIFFGVPGLWGLVVFAAVIASSLYMGRHTTGELLLGAAIPIVSMAAAYGVLLICSVI